MPKDDRPPGFFLYVDDISSDGKVEAMTTEQFGAYMLLLFKAWRETPAGSIPNDDNVLARWSRLSHEKWLECKSAVLSAFRAGTDGRWHQKRMAQEYAKTMARRKVRTQVAKRASDARWKDKRSMMHAPRIRNALPEDCHPSSSSISNKPPPPESSLIQTQIARTSSDENAVVAGGNLENSWENQDTEARVRLALKAVGFNLYNDLINECKELEIRPFVVLKTIQEYEANVERFNTPGAIAQKLRTGSWPADGVVTVEEAKQKQEAKKQRSRQEVIDSLRYRMKKDFKLLDVPNWTDEQVIAKARELKLIK